MKKQIKSDGFNSLVESITNKMVACVKTMNQAQVEGNTLLEREARNKLFAYDIAMFSINLHSSVIDEKAPDGSN